MVFSLRPYGKNGYYRKMRAQRGNILFLILLAVVLFAALAYAVTSSMRGGGRDASQESLRTQVAAIQNFGMQVRTALTRMTLTGGLQPWQIDYAKDGYALSGANTNCTTGSCRLHDPEGGGVNGYAMPSRFLSDGTACPAASTWNGRYHFVNHTVKGIGIETERDLVLRIQGVSLPLCLAVNEANGIANASAGTVPPLEQYQTSNTANYSGALSNEVTLTDTQARLGDQATGVNGKQMFCLRESGTQSGCYHIYYVLLER